MISVLVPAETTLNCHTYMYASGFAGKDMAGNI